MKTIKGKYWKETVERDVSLFVMEDNDASFAGIDLTKLTEEEVKVLKEAVDEYYAKLKPFISSAYRRFSKSKFTSLEQVEV